MQLSPLTFVFEIINFLVLVFLLQRIVYRPLQRGLAERRKVLADREVAAELTKTEALALQQTCEARGRELDDLREEVLREAAEKAAEERARMLEQAREDAAAERARAQRLLDMEREAALGWIREMAVERSTELAGRLLMRLAPEAVQRALVDMLLDAIRQKPEVFQSEIQKAKAGTPSEVEIVWAKIPKDTEIARVREVLAELSPKGSSPLRFSLREDASLMEGAVLRIGFHVFDASIAGQLAALRDRARSMLEGAQP